MKLQIIPIALSFAIVEIALNVVPCSAASPSLLVADEASGQVLRYDGQTGASMGAFVSQGSGGLCGGNFVGPGGMVFGSDGHLYVTCAENDVGLVLRYDGDTGAPHPGPHGGIGTAEFVRDESGQLLVPHGLAFGEDGNLYVASRGQLGTSPGDADRVLRYDGSTGALLDVFVDTSSGGLDGPTGIVFSPWDGHLCVSSMNTNQVLRYDGASGAYLGVFSRPGPLVPMGAPQELRFGLDGNLYVASAGSGNVGRFDGQNGQALDSFVPTNQGGLLHPTGLQFGTDGNLYVADWLVHSILRFDGQTGNSLPGPFGAPGTAEFVPVGTGGMEGPYGLVFFPAAAIPTASEWSAVMLAVGLITAGTIVLRRFRRENQWVAGTSD